MHNTYNIHKGAFEPCHIADEASPFTGCERKSSAHTDRFSVPVSIEGAESVADLSVNAGENGNMQKNNNNMSNL